MATDKVRDDLLLFTDALAFIVKEFFELVEQRKAGFAHELQDFVAGVFWGYLQASAYVVVDKFPGVFFVIFAQFLVVCFLQ